MRLWRLDEAGAYGDAAAEADETLNKIGALASKARAKFTGVYKDASNDVKSDLKASPDTDTDVGYDADMMISTIVEMLQRPTSADELLSGMADFDANELHEFQMKLELIGKRLSLTPKILRTGLRVSLDAQDRTDDRLNDLMAELDDEDLDRVETAYMHGNNEDINSLWADQLTSDDIQERQGGLMRWLKKTSDMHAELNNAAQGKQYYTGAGLAKVLRGQLQIMDRRMDELRRVAKSAEAQPKQMKEALVALRSVLRLL